MSTSTRGRLFADDLTVVNGVAVMSPTRLALETVTLGNPEAALCVLNDFLRRGLTTPEALRSKYVEMQTWPGTRAAEILLRLADGAIESVGESRVFWAVYQQGLPKPVPQYEVRGPGGEVVARLDFAWPDLGVWLEFDGRVKYEKHLRDGERASDVVVREKKREDLVRRITGWRCIRITWADLEDPVRLAAILADALGTRC